MLPDRVSNPGPLTYESDALRIVLRGPAASSIVHATEIHLRSLIGTRTCMRVYMNSAELDAQSERGIFKSSAEKIYMRIAL